MFGRFCQFCRSVIGHAQSLAFLLTVWISCTADLEIFNDILLRMTTIFHDVSSLVAQNPVQIFRSGTSRGL